MKAISNTAFYATIALTIVGGLFVATTFLVAPNVFAWDTGGAGDGCCGGEVGGGFGDFGGFDGGEGGDSNTTFTFTSCDLSVDRNEVQTGDDVTLTWETTGFTDITLNGETLSNYDGHVTIQNLQENTTYTLQALNYNGASCVSSVTVTCLPPPPTYCELEITKAVNKTTAVIGDSLEYTMVIKNVGDADCTNVQMHDALDDWFGYTNYTYTSSFTSGTGSYTAGDNTFHFDAGTVKPNQYGSIVVMGTVLAPTQCGDFTIPNKAKVTASELSSYVYSQQVTTAVDNDCVNPAPECTLTPTLQYIDNGDSATLTWTTDNATAVTLTGFGPVELDGTRQVSPTVNTTYTLTATGLGGEVTCPAEVKINTEVPVPSCDLFEITPNAIVAGETATIKWETSNATKVVINNGINEVVEDGEKEISPLADTTYVMTVFGVNDQQVTCEDTITVSPDPVPVCKLFTATPTALPYGGGDVTLNWEVENAATVSINPIVGSVGLTGTQSVAVTGTTNFVLTAIDDNGDEVTCPASVTVADQDVFSCANNVSFTASDTSIDRGDDITLAWTVTDADSVSINDVRSTALSDTEVVSPSDDITYTLVAKRGTETISCPLSVNVSTGGGGGGGTVTPRCELDISDKKITRGEEIEIEWDTTNAREVTLIDDRGNILFTTDDYLADDKVEYYDGAITLKPTRDTEYTLIVERGSRDRECEVSVEVEDDVVVLETRDQQPLVSGIALTQVPYTGFEAGPVLTALFYMLLIAWSLFVTYLIVIRNRATAPVEVFMTSRPSATVENVAAMKKAEAVRPDVFAASVASPVAAPANLPTGTPVVGYEAVAATHQATDAIVTELENRAHSQKALLSSDAVRYFISTTEGSVERHEALDAVIAEAKANYPLEDGWIVVNEARMRHLCDTCLAGATASTNAPFIPAVVPEGTGSLAEAIVTGNVVAAYEMIGGRPMFALADAAADLDAVYRARKGVAVQVSNLLATATTNLSDEQIKEMIAALTGALDGTYTDEASAVKMAIMKAVKVVG